METTLFIQFLTTTGVNKLFFILFHLCFYNVGTDDSLKISIGDLHTRVYYALAYTTVLHLDQVKEAVFVPDRGRAMALRELLIHKF